MGYHHLSPCIPILDIPMYYVTIGYHYISIYVYIWYYKDNTTISFKIIENHWNQYTHQITMKKHHLCQCTLGYLQWMSRKTDGTGADGTTFRSGGGDGLRGSAANRALATSEMAWFWTAKMVSWPPEIGWLKQPKSWFGRKNDHESSQQWCFHPQICE